MQLFTISAEFFYSPGRSLRLKLGYGRIWRLFRFRNTDGTLAIRKRNKPDRATHAVGSIDRGADGP